MTESSPAQVRLDALFELVRVSGQAPDVAASLAQWQEQGTDARMLGFLLRRQRVRCPSCGMNGASFVACDHCGGPACDNCRNAAQHRSLCAVCRSNP